MLLVSENPEEAAEMKGNELIPALLQSLLVFLSVIRLGSAIMQDFTTKY
jgi:hypothetical protein